jgi:hypothetical protein
MGGAIPLSDGKKGAEGTPEGKPVEGSTEETLERYA